MTGLDKIIPGATQDNTPQDASCEKIRTKMVMVFNATSSSSITWTDLDLSAYIGADTDNVYLWIALMINSGAGYAVLGVRPKLTIGVAQAHLVYANIGLPMFSLCPILKTNAYGKIQYQVIVVGVANYTTQIWLSGYSTSLVAHKHNI